MRRSSISVVLLMVPRFSGFHSYWHWIPLAKHSRVFWMSLYVFPSFLSLRIVIHFSWEQCCPLPSTKISGLKSRFRNGTWKNTVEYLIEHSCTRFAEKYVTCRRKRLRPYKVCTYVCTYICIFLIRINSRVDLAGEPKILVWACLFLLWYKSKTY